MKSSIIVSTLVSAALLLCASPSFAADVATPGDTGKAGAAEKKASAKATKANKTKLVDINSASKAELKSLPNIDDAKADRIIAGRPYLSKAHLVTRKIIAHGEYEIFKRQIIARQKPEPAVKPGKK